MWFVHGFYAAIARFFARVLSQLLAKKKPWLSRGCGIVLEPQNCGLHSLLKQIGLVSQIQSLPFAAGLFPRQSSFALDTYNLQSDFHLVWSAIHCEPLKKKLAVQFHATFAGDTK